MDKSETYIKMCEKAEEIQWVSPEDIFALLIIPRGKVWITKLGNYYFRPMPILPTYILGISQPIWLPTQAQLQKILKTELDECDFGLVELFFNYVWGEESPPNQLNSPLNTMEQFWLAFVMKEKYNKVWNGEDWVNG